MSIEEFIIELDSRGENTGHLGFNTVSATLSVPRVKDNLVDKKSYVPLVKFLESIEDCHICCNTSGVYLSISVVKISKLLHHLNEVVLTKPINILNSTQCYERYHFANRLTNWSESSSKLIVFNEFSSIFKCLEDTRQYHEKCIKTILSNKELLWKTIQSK